jgi:hypothetical protein
MNNVACRKKSTLGDRGFRYVIESSVSKIREEIKKKKQKIKNPRISTQCEKKNLEFGIPFQKVATTGVGEEDEFDLSLSVPPCGDSILTDPNARQKAEF